MWSFPLRRPLSLPLLVAGLLGLLAVLATLQYRWVGQLSEAEQTRMRAFAHARAEQLARDFDREVTRSFLYLAVESRTWRERDWARYAERYDRWAHRVAHPLLVKDVLVVEQSAEGGNLWRFDPPQGRFLPIDWTPDLLGLKPRLARSPHDSPGANRGGPADLVDEAIPALVIPIMDRPSPVERNDRFGPMRLVGLTVILLDLSFIQRELLPALSQRYFGPGGDFDYNVTVVRQTSPRDVLYQSDLQSAAGPGDAEVGVFGLRFDEANAEDLKWLAPPPGRGDHEPGLQRHPFPSRRGRGRLASGDDGHWRLEVAHRSGSVEAAVASARRRNLMVSFGILFLLGVSAWMIVVSSQRARRLAERQMAFVAGVSHELRTPVAVICSAGENLADGLILNGEQVRRYGTVVRDEGRRLAEIVEQVLEFAGTSSGCRAYHFEAIGMGDLVRDALAATDLPLKQASFNVDLEILPGLPPVRADAGALRRAIQNLIENAVKYGAGGRWIGIRAEALSQAGADWVRLTVADRGLGIAAEDARHIFEPFFRGREAVASQIRGSGLGLSLVKRIVEAHGGTVGFESAPGRGSAFRIVLPAAVAAPEESESRALEEHGTPDPAR